MARVPLWLLVLSILPAASGCASNVVDSDLLVSNTIFMPPPTTRTVFIQNRNSSDNQRVTLDDLASRLTARGYDVVRDPEAARYVVLTNIVYCSESRPDLPVEAIVASGYGTGVGRVMSSLSGLAGMAGSMASMHPAGAVGVGVGQMAISGVSSVVGGVADLFSSNGSSGSQEVIYACVVDIQITDRSQAGAQASAQSAAGSAPATTKPDISSPMTGVYQARLGASVQQRKLNLDEATPLVHAKLSSAVAGHF
jgi:hypothetical protein